MNIRSGDAIDSIQGVWLTPSGTEITGSQHGGDGGSLQSFRLGPDEYITRIEGRSGAAIDQLKFTTNKGTSYGPYGGDGGDPFSIMSNLQVSGFFGRSGSALDAIGFFTPGTC